MHQPLGQRGGKEPCSPAQPRYCPASGPGSRELLSSEKGARAEVSFPFATRYLLETHGWPGGRGCGLVGSWAAGALPMQRGCSQQPQTGGSLVLSPKT